MQKVLKAFDVLPKPVLLHCSAGMDRTAPVAAYIACHEADNNIFSPIPKTIYL